MIALSAMLKPRSSSALALLKNGSRNADRSFSDSTFFLEQGRIL
jgi:hypothetical protein